MSIEVSSCDQMLGLGAHAWGLIYGIGKCSAETALTRRCAAVLAAISLSAAVMALLAFALATGVVANLGMAFRIRSRSRALDVPTSFNSMPDHQFL
jgi:hypothetical protein